jgi:ubiquinone/menaquinone biosynthesis C-methylase UbiE
MNNQKYIPALKFHWLTKIYDWLISTFMPEKEFKETLLNNAAIKAQFNVLDYGVGTATLSIMAYNNNNQAIYQGIDIDAKILSIAKQKIERNNLPIQLIKYNGGVLPFEANSMDRIISSLVIHHLTDEQKVEAFREFKRILKQNGEVHIADWSKPTSFIMRLCFHLVQFLDGYKTTSANVKGKLPEILKSAGFSQVEITHNFNSVLGTVGLFKIKQ